MNESSTWSDSEACPKCGAIYSKVAKHVASTAEKAAAAAAERETQRQAEVEAEKKREAAAESRQAIAKRNTEKARQREQRRIQNSKICRACGSIEPPARITKGSLAIEIVLWVSLIGIPVALVYSIWRQTSKYWACGACHSPEIIPVATPAGQRLFAEYHGSPGKS
jgi:ribosomal protein S27AE